MLLLFSVRSLAGEFFFLGELFFSEELRRGVFFLLGVGVSSLNSLRLLSELESLSLSFLSLDLLLVLLPSLLLRGLLSGERFPVSVDRERVLLLESLVRNLPVSSS